MRQPRHWCLALLVAATSLVATPSSARLRIEHVDTGGFEKDGKVVIYAYAVGEDGEVANLVPKGAAVALDGEAVEGEVAIGKARDQGLRTTVAILMCGTTSYTLDLDGDSVFTRQRKAFAALTSELAKGDQIGVWQYHDTGYEQTLAWTKDRDEAEEKIKKQRVIFMKDDSQPSVTPRLYDAINAVLNAATTAESKLHRRRVLLVMSDGMDRVSRETKKAEAKIGQLAARAKQLGMTIFVVGFSEAEKASLQYLQDLAERTGGAYVAITSRDAIEGAFEKVASMLTGQYAITFTPDASWSGGSGELKVTVATDTGDKLTGRYKGVSLSRPGAGAGGQPMWLWFAIGGGVLLLLVIVVVIVKR